jgi:hypothetical protein
MLVSFDRTVLALTESIIREQCPGQGADHPHSCDAVVRFLLDQHQRMPDYLRLPFRCMTLLFDAWPLPLTGRPFHCAPHEQRWRQIRAWKGSAVGFRRDLIKFYETFAIFAWYSERYACDNER